MGSISKENKVIALFFNNPTKHWHFEEVLRKSSVSRSKAHKWLLKFTGEKIVKHIKPRREMPYYVGNFENSAYQNRNKIYALEQFYSTGFLNHLSTLPRAKTVIIFGSFSRWDWHEGSDIDIFIYGDDDEFKVIEYETRLNRDIQVFTARTMNDLKKMGEGLISNILTGHLVKGNLDFIEVKLHA